MYPLAAPPRAGAAPPGALALIPWISLPPPEPPPPHSRRGCTSVEQSIIGGCAHLLSFNGSDTMSAGFYAQVRVDSPPPLGGPLLIGWGHRNGGAGPRGGCTGWRYTSRRAVHIRNELAFLPLPPPSDPALVPPQRRLARCSERPRDGAQRHAPPPSPSILSSTSTEAGPLLRASPPRSTAS